MSEQILQLGHHELTLLPQRAVWWPSQQTLVLADLHFGKTAILRHAGIPVPEGPDALTLQRLDHLIEMFSPQRLLLLGDVIHGSLRRHTRLIEWLAAWRKTQAQLIIEAIVGNHDRQRDLLAPVFDWRAPQSEEAGLIFCHEPPADALHAPWLGGHWHPMARLRAAGDALRLPIYSREPNNGLVLPAFGEFTGGMDLTPTPGRQRFIVTDDRVISID